MVTASRVRAAAGAVLAVLLALAPAGPSQAAGPGQAAGPSAAAGPTPDAGLAAVIAKYESEIPRLMTREDLPGLALALVDGDRVVWQEGFGHTDGADSRPVTVDTMFSVQSMSKAFTATAVLQAVQAGLLDLDVPITTYLPGFTVHSAFEVHPERRITLRMLLGHTAGFTHEAPLGNNYDRVPGDFDAHVRSISDTWLRFPVGTGCAYSNLGIDLAGRILEQVWHKTFPAVMHDSLLAPLGMDHSSFDRATVRATTDRAVGDSGAPVAEPVDIPMTAAGGLWASAADLGRFLRFQLGNGTFDGRTVLDAALMTQMRTVPAPDAGAPAGYALGVARTHWRAGQYLDLFSHGGGGFGFIADLWWLPQLQLGIAVVTNSSTHHLQGDLALGILHDLVSNPQSLYYLRILGLPIQSDVVEPDSHFVPPADLAGRIAALAMPATRDQLRRWAGYLGLYRAGRLGAIDPTDPPARFHVEAGVPWFDATEDGTPVRHRLTEFQPGRFLSENGETLDLAGSPMRWRGLTLNPVSGGPLAVQWALLAAVAVVAAWWLLAGVVGFVSRRRRGDTSRGVPARNGLEGHSSRRLVTAVAGTGAVAALLVAAGIRAVPGVVDVGFLGWLGFPLAIRLALHLPLAVAAVAVALAALLVFRAVRYRRVSRTRPRDIALTVALTVLAAQLAAWQLVAWGF